MEPLFQKFRFGWFSGTEIDAYSMTVFGIVTPPCSEGSPRLFTFVSPVEVIESAARVE